MQKNYQELKDLESHVIIMVIVDASTVMHLVLEIVDFAQVALLMYMVYLVRIVVLPLLVPVVIAENILNKTKIQLVKDGLQNRLDMLLTYSNDEILHCTSQFLLQILKLLLG